MQKEIGKPKFEYKSFAVDEEIYNEVEANYKDKMYEAVQAVDKEVRDENIDKLTDEIVAYFTEKVGEEKTEELMSDIATSIHDLEKKCVREMIYNEHKRPDGRIICVMSFL